MKKEREIANKISTEELCKRFGAFKALAHNAVENQTFDDAMACCDICASIQRAVMIRTGQSEGRLTDKDCRNIMIASELDIEKTFGDN